MAEAFLVLRGGRYTKAIDAKFREFCLIKPEIGEAKITTGTSDAILKVRVDDMKDVSRLAKEIEKFLDRIDAK